VLALVRGDDQLEIFKLITALGAEVRPATPEEIKSAFGADPGSIGPIGFGGEIVADETLRDGQFVAGANRTGWHLRGVEAGRDYQARFADIRVPVEGDLCIVCGGELTFRTAIEVGHIFKLGTRYSIPLEATFLDEDGQEKPLVMGSYGIGVARVMAAAVEQSNDDNGIIWPPALAPYDVHIVALPGVEEQAEEAARVLSDAGAHVLLDDRDRRAGEKFADADLIGLPRRVTVGRKTLEDGMVDLRDRATGDERRVEVSQLGKEV
jgi:prolyl-tRNA synthetase